MPTALAAVDVVRPTTASTAAITADVLSIAAWLAITLLVALALVAPTGPSSLVRFGALGAASAAAVMRVVAVADTVGATLLQRRVVGAVATAVVAVLLVVTTSERAGLRDAERRAAVGGLALLGVGAVAVGGPRAGGVGAVGLTAAAASATLLVVVGLTAMVARRNPTAVTTGPVLAAVVLAGSLLAWPVGVQPSGYSSFSTDIDVADGTRLTLTVAPGRPGANEVHLYVFDEDGALTTVRDGTIAIDDDPPVVLLPAGIGHVQALGLPFPSPVDGVWTVSIRATTGSGPLETTTEVPADG